MESVWRLCPHHGLCSGRVVVEYIGTQEALVLHRLLDQRQTSVEDVDAMGEGKASNDL